MPPPPSPPLWFGADEKKKIVKSETETGEYGGASASWSAPPTQTTAGVQNLFSMIPQLPPLPWGTAADGAALDAPSPVQIENSAISTPPISATAAMSTSIAPMSIPSTTSIIPGLKFEALPPSPPPAPALMFTGSFFSSTSPEFTNPSPTTSFFPTPPTPIFSTPGAPDGFNSVSTTTAVNIKNSLSSTADAVLNDWMKYSFPPKSQEPGTNAIAIPEAAVTPAPPPGSNPIWGMTSSRTPTVHVAKGATFVFSPVAMQTNESTHAGSAPAPVASAAVTVETRRLSTPITPMAGGAMSAGADVPAEAEPRRFSDASPSTVERTMGEPKERSSPIAPVGSIIGTLAGLPNLSKMAKPAVSVFAKAAVTEKPMSMPPLATVGADKSTRAESPVTWFEDVQGATIGRVMGTCKESNDNNNKTVPGRPRIEKVSLANSSPIRASRGAYTTARPYPFLSPSPPPPQVTPATSTNGGEPWDGKIRFTKITPAPVSLSAASEANKTKARHLMQVLHGVPPNPSTARAAAVNPLFGRSGGSIDNRPRHLIGGSGSSSDTRPKPLTGGSGPRPSIERTVNPSIGHSGGNVDTGPNPLDSGGSGPRPSINKIANPPIGRSGVSVDTGLKPSSEGSGSRPSIERTANPPIRRSTGSVDAMSRSSAGGSASSRPSTVRGADPSIGRSTASIETRSNLSTGSGRCGGSGPSIENQEKVRYPKTPQEMREVWPGISNEEIMLRIKLSKPDYIKHVQMLEYGIVLEGLYMLKERNKSQFRGLLCKLITYEKDFPGKYNATVEKRMRGVSRQTHLEGYSSQGLDDKPGVRGKWMCEIDAYVDRFMDPDSRGNMTAEKLVEKEKEKETRKMIMLKIKYDRKKALKEKYNAEHWKFKLCTNAGVRRNISKEVERGPYHQACFTFDPIEPGYVFVEKGNVYITRMAKKLAAEAERVAYVVRGPKDTYGIQVPSEIYEKTLLFEEQTREDRKYVVDQRESRDKRYALACLDGMFRAIPTNDRDLIVHRAFEKLSGRVGRSSKLSLPERLRLATIAHIRHRYTNYGQVLVDIRTKNPRMSRENVRKSARERCHSNNFSTVWQRWLPVPQAKMWPKSLQNVDKTVFCGKMKPVRAARVAPRGRVQREVEESEDSGGDSDEPELDPDEASDFDSLFDDNGEEAESDPEEAMVVRRSKRAATRPVVFEDDEVDQDSDEYPNEDMNEDSNADDEDEEGEEEKKPRYATRSAATASSQASKSNLYNISLQALETNSLPSATSPPTASSSIAVEQSIRRSKRMAGEPALPPATVKRMVLQAQASTEPFARHINPAESNPKPLAVAKRSTPSAASKLEIKDEGNGKFPLAAFADWRRQGQNKYKPPPPPSPLSSSSTKQSDIVNEVRQTREKIAKILQGKRKADEAAETNDGEGGQGGRRKVSRTMKGPAEAKKPVEVIWISDSD